MSKSYRIRTKPGEDDGYLKVNVDLNQNYDFLEILSLKISQTNEYQGFCADYGVIAGRIDINNGFGVPNVNVSIFVPIQDEDIDNPVISAIYPYTSPTNDQKNDRGVRYNLLPSKQQSFDHTPVGTFPSKRQVLDNGTTLEIYEKYYKYTTTTNEAGDFILFGVPVGDHTLHYDMDVSDIGFLSARPYELIGQGYSEDLFDNRFKFKSSNNLANLSQIFSDNIQVTVHPYWCDSLQVGSTIGIVRKDISIDLELIPSAIFTGSIFSDDEKDSLNKNCRPDRDMGKMNEVITGGGKIEAIRRTIDGDIEKYEVNGDAIDDNGNWSIQLPMNLRKVVTDEFGNLVPSPDGIKGVATEADFRFRISMDKSDTDKRLRQRVKFLVPNLTGNYNFGSYSYGSLKNTDHWKKNEQLSLITKNTPYEDDLTNQYNYIEDFFTFRWKKVYTVKQYIGRFQKSRRDETRAFIGIKDIVNGYGVNKFPSNRLDTNVHPLYTIICILLTFFAHLVAVINGIIQIINGLITVLCNIKFPWPPFICSTSYKGITLKLAYQVQKYDDTAGQWDNWKDAKDSYPTGLLDIDAITGGDVDPSYGIDASCGDIEEVLKDYRDETWEFMYPADVDDANYNARYPKDIDGTMYSSAYCANGASSANWGWCYNHGSCNSSGPTAGCRRWRFAEKGSSRNMFTACQKASGNAVAKTTDQALKDNCTGLKLLGRCWNIKIKCIFGGIMCKNCNDYCAGAKFSCCPASNFDKDCNDNPAVCGGIPDGCCDGRCCIKVPLISLKCNEENIEIKPSIIPNPISAACNKTFIIPFSCLTCGGLQTPVIKTWVACVLEPVAVWLKMVKFDFYNDWVGGSLYFPLIKRKYKVKKSKKKFGQIKKDKFCHYNCRSLVRANDPPNFQGNDTYTQDRIKLEKTTYAPVEINIQGCRVNLEANIITNWYGDSNSTQLENKNLASKEISLAGTNAADKNCQITFDNYSALDVALGNNQYTGLQVVVETKTKAGVYGEPDYVETISNGYETWENQGGFGMHKNRCDPTRLIERREYFKDSLDCVSTHPGSLPGDAPIGISNPDNEPPQNSTSCLVDCDTLPLNPLNSWQNDCCKSTCSTNGVAGCNVYCPCTTLDGLNGYNNLLVEHGLITWHDQELYYTSIVPDGDPRFKKTEYKGNLMLPTTIMELGSTTYCDIDDVPFIMDQLQPTTFQVSYESLKYKINDIQTSSEPYTYSLEYGKDKEGALNLRAYVDFTCLVTNCLNTAASVNQSQIGVDILDTNDLDIEIGNCFMRFEHDVEVREYFCRRFSGYKDQNLNVHYMSPGSDQFDNDYQTYPEITLVDDPQKEYVLVDDGITGSGDTVFSTYNGGDPFVPGDGCGFYSYNSTGDVISGVLPDYFYGLAPGQTSNFINFPNQNNQTIDFGLTAHPDGTDEIGPQDENNGSETINAIKYNRNQTPYYLYFGLIPGKTALHKTVGKFFADKINAVTLQGIGASADEASENTNNRNNIRHQVDNPFSIYKTCLGETLIASQTGGGSGSGGSGGSGGVNNPGGNIGNTTPIGIGGTTGLANPPGSGGLSTNPGGSGTVGIALPNTMSTTSGGGQFCYPATNIAGNYECKMGDYFPLNTDNEIVGNISVNKGNTTLTFEVVNDISGNPNGCKLTGGALEIWDSNGLSFYVSPVNTINLPIIGSLTYPPYQVTVNHPNLQTGWQYQEVIPLPIGEYTFKLKRRATVNPGCTTNNGRVEMILTG